MEAQAPGLAGLPCKQHLPRAGVSRPGAGLSRSGPLPRPLARSQLHPQPSHIPAVRPRGPGSRCPQRRKRRPDPAACPPAAAHPGSAPAAPRTAGSAPAAPPGSGPWPAPRGGHTGRGTATTTPRAASSRAAAAEPTSAGSPASVSTRAAPAATASAGAARRCQGNCSAAPTGKGTGSRCPTDRSTPSGAFYILFYFNFPR